MNTTSAEGLPNLPPLPEPRLRPYKHLDTVYYTAAQMKDYARAYGELCRRTASAAEGRMGEYDRPLIEDMLNQFADALELGELDGAGRYTEASIREQADLLRDANNAEAAGVHTARLESPADSPATLGEDDENIANIESYAGVLDRMAMCNARTADDFNLSQAARHIRDYCALLRTLANKPEGRAVGGRDRLWDSQWVNIVNHDNCYRDYTKEEAVAKAVKLTEAAMRENSTTPAAEQGEGA